MALRSRDVQEAATVVDEPGANGPAYGATGTGESPVKKRINTSAGPMKVSSGTDTLPRLHDHHPKPPPPPPPTPSLHGAAACALIHPPPTLQRNAAFRGGGAAEPCRSDEVRRSDSRPREPGRGRGDGQSRVLPAEEEARLEGDPNEDEGDDGKLPY